ncbi:deoxynucleotidyltransferase terminal-interacting protein 1-like isoform X2 [Asterias rubens]|uniref:deoxynucleotidyltransferase terminal-interacting protein 1-like isoform X1 n=1 Tax=Asterias rubens TaxID=7604 RepID=UPI001455B6D0|nr:deoxynucleotidyltransferase terminal-interacting protein 1-like isoform X1 [Asterias rubens]XP_033627503.1 deoxynucleotidyltransferase terminal-interacting protein 1-like isoform X2 [Asterias rubens]
MSNMKPFHVNFACNDGEHILDQQENKPFPKTVRNPFCMTLKTFPVHKHPRLVRQPGMSYKTRSGGSTFNPIPTLDFLRGTLQHRINKDIQNVYQKYARFFQMAVENIQANNGKDSVTEDHVLSVFRTSLEEAKSVFYPHGKFVQDNQHGVGAIQDYTANMFNFRNTDYPEEAQEPSAKHMKLEDGETATFSLRPTPQIQTRKRKGRPPLHHRDYTDEIPVAGGGGYKISKPKVEVVKKEGPKWDPARLTKNSQFVMGARANKALGLGNTRGRLYIKHPDLFKYSGDQDDKQWLYEHHLMPATGGKAYMLLLEDIIELANTDEYRDNNMLENTELKIFEVPEYILEKIKIYMETNRTDGDAASYTTVELTD